MATISTNKLQLITEFCLKTVVSWYTKYTFNADRSSRGHADRSKIYLRHSFPSSPRLPPPNWLHQIPVGVLLLGCESEILFCNALAERLLSCKEQELLGTTAFGNGWQVFQADGTAFTDTKVLQQPQENLVLGVSHPKTGECIWLLVNTQFYSDENVQIICTLSDITEGKQAEINLTRSQNCLEKQNNVLLALARSKSLAQGNLNTALDEITEVAADTFGLERVSIWLYSEHLAKITRTPPQTPMQAENSGNHSKIHCINLYEKTANRHTSGIEIAAVSYPEYFKALEQQRTIAVNDAYTDLRTKEFASEYLPALGVTSMLDAPIWLEGQMVGVVCHEHIGTSRQWSLEEQHFAGSIADLVTLVLEANQRQLARVAFRQSEARFHKLTANVPGLIYQFLLRADGEAVFPYISSYCWELFELHPLEVQQNADLLIAQIHPGDRQSFQESVTNSATTLQPWIWEGRFITPSGKIKWISGASRPEKLDNGILWDGLLMDITKRKQAEDELVQAKEELEIRVEERTKALKEANKQLLVKVIERSEAQEIAETRSQDLQQALEKLKKAQAQLVQSEKMSSLGNMVAGVAHEINNPISFIAGNLVYANMYIQDLLDILRLYQEHYPKPAAEILRRSQDADLEFTSADLPKLLASMQVGAGRISQIVLSLRNFSRLDEAQMKSVNLHEGIDNTLLILQHRLKFNNRYPEIKIIKEYGDLPNVECYPSKLNQVFLNILGNAIDAIKEFAFSQSITKTFKVSINTEKIDPCYIRIRISDNGCGMTPEVQQRIFDPFFTTKPVGKGTGLGLSISYQIVVQNHQGVLECTSEPGKGTAFDIKIPICLH
ncbi:MAG: GAF domain-containing protein [Cyanomargarita calcarea GSE-NOS-MK-12-04C]|uniref:histidine kinase n=1 Tax=Cyanomargarita calcarea GSE-NOS-MK-12-04C TaxID=2839659 RepID=A0A951UUB8_9CYAN|nr:GAF domain-containing protein [Cyanomargarita calcarea GSE-NOS-MK-12-04C]